MTVTGNVSTDQALAGFIAAAVSTCLLHPLDLIKTRFQINASHTSFLGKTAHTWKQIQSENGLRGLYRGLSPNFIGNTSSWALYFLWYDMIKQSMRDSKSEQKLSATDHLMASASAGALTQLFTNPIWVIKTRMCASNASDPQAIKGLIDGLRTTWKAEGLAGLYKGLGPGLLGVSHGAVQFMVYEELKQWTRSTQKPSGTLEYISMAATSKIVATVLTYPYQVLRARIQNERGSSGVYRGISATLSHIYRHEGMYGFYKGLGPNMIRVLPGTCITFGVYEGLSSLFKSIQ